VTPEEMNRLEALAIKNDKLKDWNDLLQDTNNNLEKAIQTLRGRLVTEKYKVSMAKKNLRWLASCWGKKEIQEASIKGAIEIIEARAKHIIAILDREKDDENKSSGQHQGVR